MLLVTIFSQLLRPAFSRFCQAFMSFTDYVVSILRAAAGRFLFISEMPASEPPMLLRGTLAS